MVMPQHVSLDPRTLLSAYAQGLFPMANRSGRIQWYTAEPRGIIPLDRFHVPGTLKSLVKKLPHEGGFEVRVNFDFETTMRSCQLEHPDGTWINDELIAAYVRLHKLGSAQRGDLEGWGAGGGVVWGEFGGGVFWGEYVSQGKGCEQGGIGSFGESAEGEGV